MARVKGAMMTRKHRNKILGLAKGYWGNKSRHYKMAQAADDEVRPLCIRRPQAEKARLPSAVDHPYQRRHARQTA